MELQRTKAREWEQNVQYYDSIAHEYDQVLNQSGSNERARENVARRFLRSVTPGKVMDFGGGTGRDLPWLTSTGYEVYFCEPSPNMRKKAMDLEANVLHSNRISFLDDAHSDFTAWLEDPPFTCKINGLLANFAVVNNIGNTELLFESLGSLMVRGALVMGLMLDTEHSLNYSMSWLQRLKAKWLHRPPAFSTSYQGLSQQVFLYSPADIRRTSSPYFILEETESLEGTGFCFFQLRKK
jgi:SAM-dependent methyltransferase